MENHQWVNWSIFGPICDLSLILCQIWGGRSTIPSMNCPSTALPHGCSFLIPAPPLIITSQLSRMYNGFTPVLTVIVGLRQWLSFRTVTVALFHRNWPIYWRKCTDHKTWTIQLSLWVSDSSCNPGSTLIEWITSSGCLNSQIKWTNFSRLPN